MANKVPKALTKQIENIEEIIGSLNGLLDGSKIKLENYDQKFLERLSEIRKMGLELRDKLEVFKNDLEISVTEEYDRNSRFASNEKEASERVINAFLSKTVKY